MKKDAEIFLQYFGIKHLADLIGRKFLINLKHSLYDGEKGESEICFQIQQYFFQVQNLCFIVPTIGLEGNSDIKNIVLTFFPSNDGLNVEYGVAFRSDYLKDDAGNKGRHIIYQDKKGSRSFRVKLL